MNVAEIPGDAPLICLVIGDPVAHSLSPLLHNRAYQVTGLSSRYTYTAARVRASDLGAAIHAVRTLGVRGLSVTVPHKCAIVPLLDEVSELASRIGAVNTVVNENGKLRGENTDMSGVIVPLRQRVELRGLRVALLGAGGAARAAAFGLVSEGAKLTIFNRTIESAVKLAKECQAEAAELGSNTQLNQFQVVVNATSVGMTPDSSHAPVADSVWSSGQLVFDLVYTPRETRMLRAAQAAGASVIYGEEMFLHQAAKQFEIFTGVPAPIDEMRSCFNSCRRST